MDKVRQFVLTFTGALLVLSVGATLLHWQRTRPTLWSRVPVIPALTEAYREGWQVSKEWTLHLAQGLLRSVDLTEPSTPSPSEQPATGLRVPLTWNRDSITEHLRQQGFGKQQLARAKGYLDYIDTYTLAALQDMDRTGVSASITLAQGILESNAGRSRLARMTNNHFGIKARQRASARQKIKAKQWEAIDDTDFAVVSPSIGVARFHDDYTYDRFEKYRNVQDSYYRHSMLLTRSCSTARKGCYAWIWREFPVSESELDITNAAKTFQPVSGIAPRDFFGKTNVPYYAAQAAGLKMAGYATSPTYHKKIAYLIDTYQLWRFDTDLLRAKNHLR